MIYFYGLKVLMVAPLRGVNLYLYNKASSRSITFLAKASPPPKRKQIEKKLTPSQKKFLHFTFETINMELKASKGRNCQLNNKEIFYLQKRYVSKERIRAPSLVIVMGLKRYCMGLSCLRSCYSDVILEKLLWGYILTEITLSSWMSLGLCVFVIYQRIQACTGLKLFFGNGCPYILLN